MLGISQARSTAFSLYQRSKQLIKDARSELEAASTQPESSSPQKYAERSRNRTRTVPNYGSRPPPPMLPPEFSTPFALNVANHPMDVFAQQNLPNHSSPQILGPSHTTSEPEGDENLRSSPTGPVESHSWGELSRQGPQSPQTSTHNNLEDIGTISNVRDGNRPESSATWAQHSQETARAGFYAHEMMTPGPSFSNSQYNPPVPTVAPEARYPSTSPPRSQPAVTTSSPPYTPPDTVGDPISPERSPPIRHPVAESVARPKPVIIQGPPKLPYLSLDDALEWRRRRRGNGIKAQLKDWQYLDRLKDRDHVRIHGPWIIVIVTC